MSSADLRSQLFVSRTRARRLSRVLRAQWLRLWWPGWRAAWGAQVGRHCRITIEPGASIILAAGAEIDDGATIAALGRGRIELDAGSFIGHHATIAARDRITVGERTFLAELTSVRDHDHDPDLPPSSGAVFTERVHIGRDSWIAAKATVVRGVTIGDRSLVAAHAVVREDVAARTLVAGVPARYVRDLDS